MAADKRTTTPTPLTQGRAKVPVIMQMEALECGAACLTMVLAYYKKWLPLEQVRMDCGISRDGSKATNILKAARQYGMTAKAMRVEPEMLRNQGRFPCIIHWEMNHFVVLCGFKGNKVFINDPAKGSVAIDWTTFNTSFTGICLLFQPTPDFVMEGRPKSVLTFARRRLVGTGEAFVFVILTTLIASLIGIIYPGFSRIFLDRLLPGNNPDWLYPFTIALLVFTGMQILVAWLQATYRLKIEGKMAIVANANYMWHILQLPMEFFSQRMTGDILLRQSTNESISSTLVNQLSPLVFDFAMLIFYVIVMLRYSVLLTAIGILSIVLNLLVSRFIAAARINYTRLQMKDEGTLSSLTLAGIELIETIKTSGAEHGFFGRWAGLHASTHAAAARFANITSSLGMIPSIVTSLADLTVLVVGIYLVMQGQFSVGMILAFQGFMQSFSQPGRNVIAAGQKIQEMRTNMERVDDVLQYPRDAELREKEGLDTASYDKLQGRVELNNITFGYARLADPLIKDLSITLERGDALALVGPSGCGKSTLSRLIAGLYQVWDGEILFDGKPRATIDRAVFTGSLAVVDQEIILFEDTIANNIKMWDQSIEDFEMILAARDANLHEDIMQRPGGYNYKIAENGKDFSGGQRQRMEIARVLAQDPTIIIMDEATSALDAKTEQEVVQNIRNRGITLIVVAHRLSTIRDCDQIIVLDHGQIVEQGVHDELYAAGGLYTRLVATA